MANEHVTDSLRGLVFKGRTAGEQSTCIRTDLRPANSAHASLVFLRLQASTGTVVKIPNCRCMFLTQASRFKFNKINYLNIQITQFKINEQLNSPPPTALISRCCYNYCYYYCCCYYYCYRY